MRRYYEYNGQGMFLFDFLSEVLESLSQLLLAYLLMALANGWSIVQGTMNKDSALNPDALGSDSLATTILFALALLSVFLQLMNKIVLYDDFLKFHDYESIPGKINVAVHVIFATVFTISIKRTLDRQSLGSRALLFLRLLALFGGLWFWVFPILVLVAGFAAHYVRHRLVTGGVLMLQSGCLILLARQISKESSLYAKLSGGKGLLLGGSSPY